MAQTWQSKAMVELRLIRDENHIPDLAEDLVHYLEREGYEVIQFSETQPYQTPKDAIGKIYVKALRPVPVRETA